jgi:hypothetical protein
MMCHSPTTAIKRAKTDREILIIEMVSLDSPSKETKPIMATKRSKM